MRVQAHEQSRIATYRNISISAGTYVDYFSNVAAWALILLWILTNQVDISGIGRSNPDLVGSRRHGK